MYFLAPTVHNLIPTPRFIVENRVFWLEMHFFDKKSAHERTHCSLATLRAAPTDVIVIRVNGLTPAQSVKQ